ncbi:MAG: PD-(D/E)XK nuclease family protein [Patescibacteria group bacterium]
MQTKEGLWKLSPSGLYGFDDCRACFWMDQHIGRAPSIPMRLNDAMDEKMKHRYDFFRKLKKLPPEIADKKELKNIRLFEDLSVLDPWRNTFTALKFTNESGGYILAGRLDEVFINAEDELIPVDFKSSGDQPKEDKQKYYRSQLHGYALMLRELGNKIADIAYLVHYFTKDRNDSSLLMEFIAHLDPVKIKLTDFEKKLSEMVEFLNSDYPGSNRNCDRCVWVEKRSELSQ